MRFVLDATAIRSGIMISGQHEWFCPPLVMGEVRKGKTGRNVELLEGISLTVLSPQAESVEKVREAAESTGDIYRLSETDIDVLALALELNAIILTDDYSIQNLARILDIKYQEGAESGIQEIFEWNYKCTGCSRTYENEPPECPVCGSDIKMIRKK